MFSVALLGSAACTAPARPPPPATRAVVWSYEVVLGADGNLDVDAVFNGPIGEGLTVEPGVERFVEDLSLREGTLLRATNWRDSRLRSTCASSCRIRYRFRLKDAAAALRDVDLALATRTTLFAPPSTWLVRPASLSGGHYRFHVVVPAGRRFVTGVRRAAGRAEDTYEAGTETFEESSFAAFGPLRVHRIAEPAVDVAIDPGLAVSDESILRWARTEFQLVSRYLGRSPAESLSMFVLQGTSEVMRGKTLGGGGVSVFLRVGTSVREAALLEDWVLCHELIHVGLPSTDRRQPWFPEGLASYVEPVIRARAGLVSKEHFWSDLVEGLPQGLPGPSDRGLEYDDSWGRTYWGGALYFLLADLAIRERTSGRRSLDDAVVAVAAAGGNVEGYEPISQIIEIGDRATGTHVLEELYGRLAKAPGREDLEALWSRLGILRSGATVRFDDQAPAAALRDAISAPRSSPSK